MPAEWKKVIVSGSSAHLSELKVGSNQQIGTTQATTFLTGSFTGSFSGSGAGLTGVIASSPNALTAGTGLSGGGTYDGSVARTFSIDTAVVTTLTATQTLTNKTLTAPVISSIVNNSNTLTLPTTADTLVGRATSDTLTNKTLTAPVIASIVNNSNTLTLPTTADTLVGRATSDTLTNKTLTLPTIGGTGANFAGSTSGTTTVIATAAAGTNTLTLPATSNDTLVGKATVDAFTNKTFNTSATGNVFQIAGTSITAVAGTGAVVLANTPTLITPNIGAATGTSLVLSGDLTVNGSTTILDTTNLSVEDRFIILNHGSGSLSPLGEGGIIVEGSVTAGVGSAFYYDGTDTRWGVALGVSENATSVTANSYVVTVSGSAANPGTAAPTYGGSAGWGNMYVNTQDSTIWIYA